MANPISRQCGEFWSVVSKLWFSQLVTGGESLLISMKEVAIRMSATITPQTDVSSNTRRPTFSINAMGTKVAKKFTAEINLSVQLLQSLRISGNFIFIFWFDKFKLR